MIREYKTMVLLGVGTRVNHVKALKAAGWRVIGTDMDPNAPALGVCDVTRIVPYRFDQRKYWDDVLGLCDNIIADTVMPASHQAVEPLNTYREAFKRTKVILPPHDLVKTFASKDETYDLLDMYHIPRVPFPKGYPMVIRPEYGAGNKMTHVLYNTTDHMYWVKKLNEAGNRCILTKYIDGEEYTVDFLADENSEPVYVVPRLRIEHKAGEVWKTRTTKDNEIIEMVTDIIRKTKLQYIGFVQLFKADDTLLINEIDTRFGGGITCSISAGADIFGKLVDVLNGIPASKISTRKWKEKTFSRYLEDMEVRR